MSRTGINMTLSHIFLFLLLFKGFSNRQILTG